MCWDLFMSYAISDVGAELLVAVAQTEEDDLQDSGFEEEVDPYNVTEGGKVEDSDAQVEGERLAGRHHRTAAVDEFRAHGFRDRVGQEDVEHLLTTGCHVLLA